MIELIRSPGRVCFKCALKGLIVSPEGEAWSMALENQVICWEMAEVVTIGLAGRYLVEAWALSVSKAH